MTGAGRAERAGRLFDAHGAELLSCLTRRIGRDAAEDPVSEAFVVMVGEDREFDTDRGGERAWLFGIATNLLHRHHRDRIRFHAAIGRAAATPVASSEDHACDVDGRIDAQREFEQLSQALSSLTAQDRDVPLVVAWARLTTS